MNQGWAEWAKQPAELHTLHWADQETGRRKVRASTKLNEESIATVGDDLTADYQVLVDHHSEEIVQLLEEFGVAEVEITPHLQEYEVERKAVELAESDSNQHATEESTLTT